MQILEYFFILLFIQIQRGLLSLRLRPPSATILNAGGGISFMLDFAPLNKQSKLLKFQIHNPVRATLRVVPITHYKLKSVKWSIYL